MRRYACSFVPGLEAVVSGALERACPDARVTRLLDGLILFDTAARTETLKRMRFVNNLFRVLGEFTQLRGDPISSMLRAAAEPAALRALRRSPARRVRTFRLVTSSENRSVSPDRGLLGAAEAAIGRRAGLRPSRAKPDVEFWLLYRREGIGLFLRRLTAHRSFDRLLDRGELRPDLCHALCLLSEPGAEDVFLDPFCGSGAIPLERARAFPFRLIFASDKDAAGVRALRRKVKATRRKRVIRSFIVRTAEALDLHHIDDGFVTRIVTDPPWGLYEELGIDVAAFYARMLREFDRVLAPGGVSVVVTARKEEFLRAAARQGVEPAETYHILVSGKKAGVYKLVKRR